MQPTWWGIGIVVALGLGLRSLQAFEDRALWLYEAMLALNIRRLSFSEFCGPLQYDIDPSKYSPGDKCFFEVTLFLESGSAVPVQIDFQMAEGQSSSSVVSDEQAL